MKTQTHMLTEHARQRISERSVTAEGSIVSMLDEGLFVPIGTEAGSSRSHELLYLAGDGHWFVAIRDVRTLELITLLPVDYHENISWKVSFEAMQLARRIATGEEPAEEDGAGEKPAAVSLKISVICEVEFGVTRRRSLGSYHVPPEFSVDGLFDDARFAGEMLGRIAEKGIAVESAFCIAVRKRRRDDEELLLVINHRTGELEPLCAASAAS